MPSHARFGLAAALVLLAPPGAGQETKLIGQSISGQDRFGEALALDGDTAVVGAVDDDSAAVDGGAAYVFTRSGSAWSQEAILLAPASEAGVSDKLGAAVAVLGDLAVVGAPQKDEPGTAGVGAVFVFERTGTVWSAGSKLVPSLPSVSHGFGESLALRGGAILIGAPAKFASLTDPGAAYVFNGAGTSWAQRAKLTASDAQPRDMFGYSVALTDTRALIGAAGDTHGGVVAAGSAYVFERFGTAWIEGVKLTASDAGGDDFFGGAVSLEGDLALVGALDDDHSGLVDAGTAYLFAERAGAWSEERQLRASDAADRDGLGAAVALQGHDALVGSPFDSLGIENADSVLGLAHDPGGGLFGVESFNGQLLAIEPFPGGYVVGDIGFDNLQGLAYDSTSGVFYGTDISTDQLIRIDATTGAGTAVGPLGGYDQVRGLAFDPLSGTLYGSDVKTDSLVVIDTAVGGVTLVGGIGFQGVQGLAFDAATGTLYGCDVTLDRLITIDTVTGAGTAVGNLGFIKVQGLSFDPVARVLYGVDQGNELLRIDPLTGAATALGPTYVTKAGSGYLFGLDLTQSYCTAGLSAGGCRATLSTAGLASATAGSGFTLSASNVEGARPGLFFFGANGRQANPWGNGSSLQCVVPPVKRGGLLSAAGTSGACDGAFAQDLNALWCAACPKPNKNPGSGALMQAQLWYRDPFNTSNQTTSFSDALEFLVGY